MKAHTRALLVLIAITGWCLPGLSQRTPRPMGNFRIQVQVRLPNGTPAPQGVMVAIELEGGGFAASGQTDGQGKFVFTPSQPGLYVVTVKYPGYREAVQHVDLRTMPTAYVVLELQPVPSVRPPALPPEGPSAQISSPIPEPALKEFKAGEKLLMREQKPADSIPHLQNAINLHRPFLQAYVLLAMAYLEQRKPVEAQHASQQAVQLDANSAAAHFALGAAFNQQKNYAAAEAELTRGLQLNPGAAEGHYELAKTYWQTGRMDSSEEHARQAAASRPDMAAVHVLLGNIMLRKNDAPSALREYNEYLRLEPDGPMAAPTRAMVAKIQKANSGK